MTIISDINLTKNTNILMTTVIRNSAHYLKDWIEYHIKIGVDSFIFNHHYNSIDGTLELLREYEKTYNNITIIEEKEKIFYQAKFINNAIHNGVKIYNPKYVVSCDVDEFLYSENLNLFESIDTCFRSKVKNEKNICYAYDVNRYNMAYTKYDINSTEHFSKQIVKSIELLGKSIYRKPDSGWSGLFFETKSAHSYVNYGTEEIKIKYLEMKDGPEMFHFPNWNYKAFSVLKMNYVNDYIGDNYNKRYGYLKNHDKSTTNKLLEEMFYKENRNNILFSKNIDRRFMKRYSHLFNISMNNNLPDIEDFKTSDILQALGLSIKDLPADFDAAKYLELNQDISNDKGDIWLIYHYLKYGVNEKRIYSLKKLPNDFNVNIYLELNPDLNAFVTEDKDKTDLNLKVHYVAHGLHENRLYKDYKISDVNKTNNTKLLLVTVVRNSIHYIKDWIEYHIKIGVDSFIFNHHYNSIDGTLELLREYEKTYNNITIIEETKKEFLQTNYMTHAFHEGVKIYNPKYVVSCDVDEFLYSKNLNLFESIDTCFRSKVENESICYAHLITRNNMANTTYDIHSKEHFSKQIIKETLLHFQGKSIYRKPDCGWSGLYFEMLSTNVHYTNSKNIKYVDNFDKNSSLEIFHFPNFNYDAFALIKKNYAADWNSKENTTGRYDHLKNHDEASTEKLLEEMFYTENRHTILYGGYIDRRFLKRYSYLFNISMNNSLPDIEDFNYSDILQALGLSIEDLPADFDVNSYIRFNPDIKSHKDIDAIYHYLKYGIKEKRIYSLKDLPSDFDVITYLELNSDLNAFVTEDKDKTELSLKIHYVAHGINENRSYKKL